MRVEYSSNNSGGSWWLEDKDWKALEDAGWEVEWGGSYFCNVDWQSRAKDPPKNHTPCPADARCEGHRAFTSYEEIVAAGQKGRWLDALATRAEKDFPTFKDAILEWENVTGKDASDEGCNCCGPPHNFSCSEKGNYQYASGEDIVEVLYPGSPRSLREAAERMRDDD